MWSELFHEESQKSYYYNESTGETTWDRPEAMVSLDTTQSSAISISNDWQELLDEASGKTYYYNTVNGETSWTKPDIPSEEVVVSPVVDELPAGWIETTDTTSGQTYFYNAETGETSWDRPTNSHEALSAASSTVIDFSWVEATVPETGQIYYYHTVTGETSWDRPAGTEGAASVLAVVPSTAIRASNPSTLPVIAEVEEEETETEEPTHHHLAIESPSTPEQQGGLSLFGRNNLHLPEYANKAEEATMINRNKRGGFVSAPDEFVADFLARGGKDQYKSSEDESLSHQEGLDLAEAIDFLEAMDWSNRNPVTITDQILTIKETVLSSTQILSYISKRVQNYSIASFAEAHFQYDRRGAQIPANMIDKLISYQSEAIKGPLTVLTPALAVEAVQCFRQIQSFMNRSSSTSSSSKGASSAPTSTANFIDIVVYLIQKIIIAPTEFSEEVYLQLCKQTRKNPSPEGNELGWQLILILLACIPPSRRLIPYLMHYFSSSVENLQEEGKKFVGLCLKCLLRSVLSTPRRELPTEREIHALLLGEAVEVRVKCVDGRVMVATVDSFTKVKDLEDEITLRLKISPPNKHIFGLFELRIKSERAIAGEDRVVDTLAAWTITSKIVSDAIASNDLNLESGASFQMDENLIPRFLYRVKYFFPLGDEDDHVALDQLYAQALNDCITAHYPHTLQDALLLAAFQLQMLNGDFIVGREIKEFRSGSSIRSLCCAPWLDRDEISRVDAESRITALYKKLTGTNRFQARNMFLKFVQSWKLYGAKYFMVKGQLDASTSGNAHDLVLAINARSVIIVDTISCSFLADYAFEQIHSWGHSFDSFVLTVGSAESQTKSYFRTSQGKEIEDLLRIYSQSGIVGDTLGGVIAAQH